MLRKIQEEAKDMLLVIAIGLYAIGAVGYAKLSHRTMLSSSSTRELVYSYPISYRILLTGIALTWPLSVYWMLVKEASRASR